MPACKNVRPWRPLPWALTNPSCTPAQTIAYTGAGSPLHCGLPDRVASAREHDRHRRGCGLGRNCRAGVMGSDHRHLTAYQIGCEVRQSVVLVLRPAILDHDILALDVTGFTNALPECGQKDCTIGRRPRAAEEPDHRHRRLLRARRKRPRGRRAADERDEVAPLHCSMPPMLSSERIAHLSRAGDCCAAGFQSGLGRFRVKMRRTRSEHILSALPPLTTEERTFGIGSSVPLPDLRPAAKGIFARSPRRR